MQTLDKTLTMPVDKTSWRDYLQLCKPKVVALLLLTAIVGMHLATPTWVPLSILVFGTLGIALAASAAAAINHIVEQEIDRQMRRTERRPLVQGKVKTNHAIIFAFTMAVVAMAILFFLVNPLTALLTFISLIGYAFVYTLYLKHATPQNIVIGGISGAAPPLLGWTAVTGSIEPYALLLVLIIFIWTPPHFWALAIHRHMDYAKAKVPMLPVTHGLAFTKTSVWLYTILLAIATSLPVLTGMSGQLYLWPMLALNAVFLKYAWQLKYTPQADTAMKTFRFSINYLLFLFLALLVDHYYHI